MRQSLQISLFSLLVLLTNSSAQACTVFESPFVGDTRYAHNVDWYTKFPQVKGVLVLNPANLKKRGELFGANMPTAEWVSKFRSFTFSIAGAEFPVSGFNEKGLSMAILELAGSAYPPPSDSRPAFGISQFVQYNLDRSASLDEVAASGKVFRPYSPSMHMHYFVCEASGKCAVIQYIAGEMKVYREKTLPYLVMTNSLYPDSVKAANACIADSYQCTPSDDSLFRFANAARMRVQEMKSAETFEQDAFGILDEVAQTGDFGPITRFQLLFDPAARKVTVTTRHSYKWGTLQVNFDEADCRKPRKVIPVAYDEVLNGDLSGRWIPLTEKFQTDMAEKMGYPPAMAAAYGRYPFQLTCLEK